jgi:hypothetical protein
MRIKMAQERCGNCKFVYWDRAHALSTRKKLWIARYYQAVQNPAGLQAICWRTPVSRRISTARGSGLLSAPGTASISSMPVCPPIQRQPQFAGNYTGRNVLPAHRVEKELRFNELEALRIISAPFLLPRVYLPLISSPLTFVLQMCFLLLLYCPVGTAALLTHLLSGSKVKYELLLGHNKRRRWQQ